MNKKTKKYIYLFMTIIAIFIIYMILSKNNSSNNNLNISESNISLTDELVEEINLLNQHLDDYYVNEWENEKFMSITSYLVKEDNSEVTLEDIERFSQTEFSENLRDVIFHFVKPETLKEYLKEGILDEDLSIITVFSAVPLKDGVYISSKYDEGGIISYDEYRNFVLSQNFEHGELVNENKDTDEYKNIISKIEMAYEDLKDGNVKHIVRDDKYASVVISSNENPNYIKHFALMKEDDEWTIILEDLAEKTNPKLAVNYAYTDFNLAILPIYSIASYPVISDLSGYLEAVKQQGFFVNEEVNYSCGFGNFVYFESTEGVKVLGHLKDENDLTVYEIEDYKEGISLMVNLEENPPVFILKF